MLFKAVIGGAGHEMGEKRILQLQCCCSRLSTLANGSVCLSVHFCQLEEKRETPFPSDVTGGSRKILLGKKLIIRDILLQKFSILMGCPFLMKITLQENSELKMRRSRRRQSTKRFCKERRSYGKILTP